MRLVPFRTGAGTLHLAPPRNLKVCRYVDHHHLGAMG